MRLRWKGRLPVGRSLALVGTAAVLVSCAINFATAPYFEGQLQRNAGGGGTNSTADHGHSNPLASVVTRAMSVACFASTAFVWSRYRVATAAYHARIRALDAYSPAAPRGRDRHAAFAAAVLAVNALLIVPVDAYRLWAMAAEGRSGPALVYYKFARCAHNAVSCLWECWFVALCYALRTAFARLNRDTEAVGRRVVDPAAAVGDEEDADPDEDENDDRYGNRFESSHGDDRTAADHRPVGTTRTTVDRRRRARTVDEDDYGRRKNRDHGDCDDCDDYEDCDDDDEDDLWVARYDESGDFVYRSRATGRSLTTVVEWFKIRHRLIREAMDALKYAFTVSIGASLCNLCIMALYDIYKYSQSFVDEGRSYVFIMLWLFQYTFRFFIIVATAHATTKQALKSKLVVSFMIKNCLDSTTKEELQIFLGQISRNSLEFSIYDLFVLKTQLFTSAIGACITHLVIILQLKFDYEQKKHPT